MSIIRVVPGQAALARAVGVDDVEFGAPVTLALKHEPLTVWGPRGVDVEEDRRLSGSHVGSASMSAIRSSATSPQPTLLRPVTNAAAPDRWEAQARN
jgi:hypothetical protein